MAAEDNHDDQWPYVDAMSNVVSELTRRIDTGDNTRDLFNLAVQLRKVAKEMRE